MKVGFFDKRVRDQFLRLTSVTSATLSLVVLFVDIPSDYKLTAGWVFLVILAAAYIGLWVRSTNLNSINIKIEGSSVAIKVGDIFQQQGLKAIAFNEYFDTQVDNKIISDLSLNGVFIKQHLNVSPAELDNHIEHYPFENGEVIEKNDTRIHGKKIKYQVGTISLRALAPREVG